LRKGLERISFYGLASALQKKIGAKARCRLIGMFIFNIKVFIAACALNIKPQNCYKLKKATEVTFFNPFHTPYFITV
jgi:hypothetical protein